ncbi:hypothetical protein KKC91_01440 [bacterium]|nr:hypothetical protein [bacterium]
MSFEKKQLMEALESGSKWLINVAQVVGTSDSMYGAMKNDYNMKEKNWAYYEPVWHTGQAIRALLAAYKRTGKEIFLKRAIMAGDYIQRLQFVDKSDPETYGLIRADIKPDLSTAHMSTMTDAFEGLFELEEVTGDRRWIEIIRLAADWIMGHTWLQGEGLIINSYDFKNKKVLHVDYEEKESRNPIKYARPNNEGATFYYLYVLTKGTKYLDVFKRLCDRLVEDQYSMGLWMDYLPNVLRTGFVHARFNLWYALSLLRGYDAFKDERYLACARRTAEWYLDNLWLDGAFPYRMRVDGKHRFSQICGSGSAMAGIFWIDLFNYIPDPRYIEKSELVLEFLLTTQYSESFFDNNLRGAFFESSDLIPNSGSSLYVVRDLATTFAIIFIDKYLRFKGEKEKQNKV